MASSSICASCKRGSPVHGFFLLGFNFLITNYIVYVNKMLFTTTKCPPFSLTCIHLLVNIVFVKAAKRARVFEPAKSNDNKGSFPLGKCICVGMLQASGVLLSQMSLMRNSVGAYQLAKLLQVPIVATIEYFWLSKTLSLNRITLLAAMILSVGLATIGNLDMNVLGTCFAISAVSATSIESVLYGHIHKAYRLTTLQVLDVTLIFSFTYMLIVTVIFEYGAGAFIMQSIVIVEPQAEFAFQKFRSVVASQINIFANFGVTGYELLAISSFLAFCINWSSVSINGTFGPVTYAVLSLFKTVSIVVMGAVFFDKGMTTKGAIGSLMALVCMGLYTRINLLEMLSSSKSKHTLLPVSNSNTTMREEEGGGGESAKDKKIYHLSD